MRSDSVITKNMHCCLVYMNDDTFVYNLYTKGEEGEKEERRRKGRRIFLCVCVLSTLDQNQVFPPRQVSTWPRGRHTICKGACRYD